MASKTKEFNKKVIIIKCLCIVLLGIICGVSMIFEDDIERLLKIGDYTTTSAQDISVVSESNMKVHYIDVGQGDSTLIELPDGTTMLIDAGTPDEERIASLISYIKNDAKVSKINYLILTHSDDDHSGGMASVLDEFEVQNIYRPFQLACNRTTSSSGSTIAGEPISAEDLKGYYVAGEDEDGWLASQVYNYAYLNFIEAAYSETWTNEDTSVSSAAVTVSHEGLMIESTDSTEPFTFGFYAPPEDTTKVPFSRMGVTETEGVPVKRYDGKNNASPIMLLEYNDRSFVFTGDAEREVENDFVEGECTNQEIRNLFTDVDVYKAGHHGSSTSSTADFLAIINPTYTVVSCGLDNSYGHPSKAFLERWEEQVSTQGTARKQTEPLRTDLNQTIIFGVATDGELVYCAGVEGSTFVIYWWYIALGIFVIGTLIIIMVKVYKNSAVKTAKSAINSSKKAKKMVDDYKN